MKRERKAYLARDCSEDERARRDGHCAMTNPIFPASVCSLLLCFSLPHPPCLFSYSLLSFAFFFLCFFLFSGFFSSFFYPLFFFSSFFSSSSELCIYWGHAWSSLWINTAGRDALCFIGTRIPARSLSPRGIDLHEDRISLRVLTGLGCWHFTFFLFLTGGFAAPEEEEEEIMHG
jgi:hypothetical protein